MVGNLRSPITNNISSHKLLQPLQAFAQQLSSMYIPGDIQDHFSNKIVSGNNDRNGGIGKKSHMEFGSIAGSKKIV